MKAIKLDPGKDYLAQATAVTGAWSSSVLLDVMVQIKADRQRSLARQSLFSIAGAHEQPLQDCNLSSRQFVNSGKIVLVALSKLSITSMPQLEVSSLS